MPSLTRGSSQQMKIRGVKTDPNDPTIQHPILTVKAFNAINKVGYLICKNDV